MKRGLAARGKITKAVKCGELVKATNTVSSAGAGMKIAHMLNFIGAIRNSKPLN